MILDRFSTAQLRDILAFYRDSGADEALEEVPPNQLAEPEAASAPRTAPARRPMPGPPAAPAAPAPGPDAGEAGDVWAAQARLLARSAGTLEELKTLIAGFDGCPLKASASSLVFADGNPSASLMIVGEAPGREEDLRGLPFVGRSGQLLDRMLKAIGLDRDRVYIANVIPWRPPGNRAPTPLETEICRPFIERQIELVAPRVLMTLGGASAKVLLHANTGVLRLRGSWRTHKTGSGLEIPAMPTLHPAYLLRNPIHKRLVWRDLLAVNARLRAPDLTE